MATKKQEQDPEAVIESAIDRSENFLYRNSRTLLSILAAAVVIVGGIYGYKHLVQGPRNDKAAGMMFVAEQNFLAGDYRTALDGDGSNAGFLEMIAGYGSTAAGNAAKHYAGLCYVQLGQLDSAMVQLKAYKSIGSAPSSIINAQNLGLQGDILSQQKDYSGAAAKYEAAAEAGDNSLSAPIYLKKAGFVYEELGDYARALEAYRKIADNYPSSIEGRDIEKYIGAVEQKM